MKIQIFLSLIGCLQASAEESFQHFVFSQRPSDGEVRRQLLIWQRDKTKQTTTKKNLKVPTSEKVTWPNFKLCFFALDVCFIAATDPQSRLLFALMQQDKTVLKPLLLSNLFIIFVEIKKEKNTFQLRLCKDIYKLTYVFLFFFEDCF